MTLTGGGSNYSIQSNRSGQGNSNHKSKRQEYQPRGEAQMKHYVNSTSYHRSAEAFDTLIEISEAEITAITVVRAELLPERESRDIPVSVPELVYGSKQAVVGAFSKPLDRENELIC
ncbi:hypothetical protein O181_017501 [Austropuccinia psidii MF-1]|uniref:Uncharacterized protein n=1 Tax=Austropuccinia psidii MF-1 TaxID=1389203 RepID=A0A9Q3C7Q3_9BASI|nr:hypothetical protein [Austropuccinia psidii MF-1]